VYLYTTRLGDPASLASMTIQTGIADVAGNVRRMDAVGCFITEFSLSNETDGILTGSFTVDGRDYIPSASAVTAALLRREAVGYQRFALTGPRWPWLPPLARHVPLWPWSCLAFGPGGVADVSFL
jgi:hypothetical protein